MSALYNEIDPAACAILERLIADNVIAPGKVVSCSIADLRPEDLEGYTQIHLFAGGGLWSVAARSAGWPDDEPIWSASCPCQPFSAAGKGLGTDDPRHLWPHVFRLASALRPTVIVGEQVAGKAGYGWFDGVRSDLAGEGYACRAVDFPACSVDAPHQRNRLYWVAVGTLAQPDEFYRRTGTGCAYGEKTRYTHRTRPLDHGIGAGVEGLAGHGDGDGRSEPGRPVATADGGERNLSPHPPVPVVQGQPSTGHQPDAGDDEGLHADADGDRRDGPRLPAGPAWEHRPDGAGHPQRNGTYWSDAEWIECHDGKARRTKPGLRFLVNGLPGRVDLWRVGGNAIVPQAAAEVIGALMDIYGLPSEWPEAS